MFRGDLGHPVDTTELDALRGTAPGAFTLVPSAQMHDALAKDCGAMAGMVFGTVLSLDDVLVSVQRLEETINALTGR